MLLAIDTCGTDCSAALYDVHKDQFLFSRSDSIGRGHSEHLLDMITHELTATRCDWHDIRCVSVVRGPGSFTGLRVGLSVARALSLSLDIPCLGISVFDALNYSFGLGESLTCVLDGRRRQFWVQSFFADGTHTDPIGIDIDSVLEFCPPSITRFVGSGSVCVSEMRDDSIDILSPSDKVDIESVARLSSTLDSTAAPAIPLYLRPADAKPQNLSQSVCP